MILLVLKASTLRNMRRDMLVLEASTVPAQMA